MINKVVNFIILAFVLYAAGVLGYQAADYSIPINVQDQKVLTTEVHIGEEFRSYVKFIPVKLCNTHTDRVFQDGAGQRFNLDSIDYETQLSTPGVQQEYTTVVPITAETLKIDDLSVLKPGDATYQTRTTYRCNLLNRWWPTIGPLREYRFKLLPAKPQTQGSSGGRGGSVITLDLGRDIDPSQVKVTLTEGSAASP